MVSIITLGRPQVILDTTKKSRVNGWNSVTVSPYGGQRMVNANCRWINFTFLRNHCMTETCH